MNSEKSWERETIEKLASASLREQKTNRRWGIFFKMLFFGYIVFISFSFFDLFDFPSSSVSGQHTGLVQVFGEIGLEQDASAGNVINGLREAFKNSGTKGVIIHINSPGGSPAQSRRIFKNILELKEDYPEIPVYAVVEDICASGAYYVAVAADEIFVDPASIVGSIGVVINGFGFSESLKKLGIQRRLFTAGDNKGFLDPFSDLNPSHEKHVLALLDQIHQQFKKNVETSRGDRLAENQDIFSGLIWTGEESIKLGLVDHIGTIDYVAKEIIGAEAIINFSHEPHFFDKLATEISSKVIDIALSFFYEQQFVVK